MPQRTIVSSFNGGELSPRLEGRVDADGIYDRGLETMFNFVPTVEGPAVKRSGFRYVKAAAASSTWLSRFVFNVTQAYVIEWLEGAVRFFTNGGQLETAPGVPYEVAVPYAAAEAPRLSMHKNFDRLYLAHENHAPAALDRTGAASFVHGALALRDGPFKDMNSNEAVTVSLSGSLAVGGLATVTASAAIFQAGHVGAPFLIECKDFSDIPAWEAGIDGNVAFSTKRRSDNKVYLATTSGRAGTSQPIHNEGTASDGTLSGQDVNGNGPYGIKWRYLYDRQGLGTIQTVLSATQATIRVTRAFADSLTSTPSHRWAHGAFSEAEGWPHLVTIWAGRLIFFKGLEMHGSVAGDYLNFSRFDRSGRFTPDMAFKRTLDAQDPPLWVKADKVALVAGTASEEILIGAVNRAAPIAGDNIGADVQSSYGSAEAWPVDVGTAVLFAQRGGRKIREAEYSYERDRFVGINITIWARHITRSGLVQLAFQQEPEELLWGVRGDGVLAAHAHSPEQQVKGFARARLGAGAVLSAVSIPSEDGLRDELWVLAEAEADPAQPGSAAMRGILKLEDWWEEDREATDAEQLARLEGAFFVDWGVSYQGAPRVEFSTGIEHLEGREVWILADGGVVTPQTVQAAEPRITLPRPASHVHIGVGYEARLKPMRPELRSQGIGTDQGLRKRIVRLVLRLIDTAQILVRDHRGNTDRLIDRYGSGKMNKPIPLFNGDTDDKSVGGGYDRAGQPEIVSADPLPCIVTAMMPTLEVEPAK